MRKLETPLSRAEEIFFGFVAGAACLSLAVFTLTALGLARTSVFFSLGVSALILLARSGRRPTAVLPPLTRLWMWIFTVPYTVFALLYLASALLPETSVDGVVYHVALPARYLREHRFPTVPSNFYEAFPQGIEMLFLFAFAFGKHTSAALVHFLFTLLTPIGMVCYGRRFGMPRAGVFGGLLFFLSPIVARTGAIAYIDVALACILFACFYALEIWRQARHRSMLVLAGLFAGFAFAAKYTGGMAVAYLLFYIAVECRQRRTGMLRKAALASAAALVMMAPWLVKNAAIAGNPLSPFANRYFPNPFVSRTVETEYLQVLRTFGSTKRSQIPLEVTVKGAHAQGLVGPVFLLTPLMLLALRRREGRMAGAAALLFALPAWATIQTRFLIPSLPFVSLGLGIALDTWPGLAVALLMVHAIASWPSVLVRYCSRNAWRFEPVSFQTAWKAHTDPSYLEQHVPDYKLGLRLNSIVPENDRIFAFQYVQQAYHDRVVVVGWQSSQGKKMQSALLTGFTPGSQPLLRHDFHFAEKAVRAIRVVQLQSASGPWSISELRILHGGVSLPRAPEWRLSASANPRDIRLAFDNNPVTAWSTDEPRRPGMFVTVNFGRLETIDQVIVECGREQGAMRIDPGGGEAFIRETLPGPWMRRAAIDYLKRSGIRWLIVRDDEDGSRDFDIRRAQWGITPVVRQGAAVLYKLD